MIPDINKDHNFTPASESAPAALRRIEGLGRWRPPPGRQTGLKQVDKLTGGLPAGELTLVAGRPSSGKSVLASMVAYKALIEEKPPCVAYFSLSESQENLILRFIALESKCELFELRHAFFKRTNWGSIESAAKVLAEAPLFIDDSPCLTVADLAGRSRALADELKARSESLGLVVIDSLELLRCRTGRIGQRPSEIARAARAVKKLARDTGAAVVIISRIEPPAEIVALAKAPSLADLDAAMPAERLADLVIITHRRPCSENMDPEQEEAAEIIIARSAGPTATVPVMFHPQMPIFKDYPAA
ncbi:MAG: DnaB-like helicase C-terminal domain-containing protein [Elusimicrobiota bacterium]